MSQKVLDPQEVALHKKRESTNLFDPDLIFEDSLITSEGVLEVKNLFSEYSSKELLDDAGADELLKYNPHIDQEFRRKYFKNRNESLEDLHYPHIGDNNVLSEEFANAYRFPRTEPYRRIPAGHLYKVPNGEFKRNMIERSKSFVKELFPPYNLKDEALIKIQEQLKDKNANREEIIEYITDIIPRINHNLMADFVLFLTFDAKIDDPLVWRAIENGILE